MKPIRRIPAGDHFVACDHIKIGQNRRVHVFDLSHRMFDIVRREIAHTQRAKWFMLCGDCRDHMDDPMRGAPFRMLQAHREISLGA